MKARGAMTMDDCGSEKTICYEEDGWSVTLTRYVSMELGGDRCILGLSSRTGGYLHSERCRGRVHARWGEDVSATLEIRLDGIAVLG